MSDKGGTVYILPTVDTSGLTGYIAEHLEVKLCESKLTDLLWIYFGDTNTCQTWGFDRMVYRGQRTRRGPDVVHNEIS